MENKRLQMVDLIEHVCPEESVITNWMKGLTIFRTNKPLPRTPVTYDPSIIILAQGQKNIYLGDEIFTYDPLHYLVLSVPLPLECEVISPPDKPILGFAINIDPIVVGELLLDLDDPLKDVKNLPKGIYGARMTDNLFDSAIRLLQSLQSEKDRRILSPMIEREIIYRVLFGEKGEALQALAYHNQRFFQINRILNKIHKTYYENHDVTILANEAEMSVSTFHNNFKTVTNTSPVQYIKSIRLNKAKVLMTQEGLNAHSAALQVGYESASQFNREYKRYFGITPAKDAITLQNHNETQV